MSRRRALAAAAAAALVLALAGAGLLAAQTFRPAAAPGAEERVFRVPKGATLGAVAERLEAQGLVREAWAFEALARWRSVGGGLRAGEYALSPSLAPGAILERIAAGRVRTHAVAIPEGWTAEAIATRLAERGLVEREAFLEVVRSRETAEAFGVEGEGLEGYLFPETYRLARDLGARAVARALVEEFHAAWDEIAPKAEAQGLGMHEVVTLASIVEKETSVPRERPLVAAVFLNRLERGMRLETDPTVIYGLSDFDGNLTRAHLDDASNPYNTYRRPGLPPGPIASPGRDALRAVVEPAEVDYLYFVSRNDGTHVFSETYREHLAAVDRFQR